MKPNLVKAPIPVDRLATPDEILAAVSPFPDPLERCGAEILREIAADLGGYVRIPAIEMETSVLMEELTLEDDTSPN
jgi:hypothetical protein